MRALVTLRAHLGFVVLVAIAAPAMLAFARSDHISMVGDDSVSYLILARHMIGIAGPLLEPWVGHHAQFPPLFPALLAASGGATDLARAHALVGVCAALALVPIYRIAALRLGTNFAGLAVTAAFLLTPGAWIAIRGILSESLFLLVSMTALVYYEARLSREAGPARRWIMFGLLLACAVLARSIGVALVAAYGLHAVLRWRAGDAARARLLLPFVPCVLLAGAWLLVRPAPSGMTYVNIIASRVDGMIHDPSGYLSHCASLMLAGWVRCFAADSAVDATTRSVFAALGIVALAGSVLAAGRNRLDGWYVLASIAIVFPWLFFEDNTRRLLYPLVPLLLLHVAELGVFIAEKLGLGKQGRRALFATAALPAVLCAPAFLLVQSKALDDAPLVAGSSYAPRDITDYYTLLQGARAAAAQEITILTGLESLARITPPGSKVMWVRPDYVAFLGRRQGVPWYVRASPIETARAARREGVDFLVLSSLVKADLAGVLDQPQLIYDTALEFSHAVARRGRAGGEQFDFVVMAIDPAALDAYLAKHDTPQAGAVR